jgi:hypothetical protein
MWLARKHVRLLVVDVAREPMVVLSLIRAPGEDEPKGCEDSLAEPQSFASMRRRGGSRSLHGVPRQAPVPFEVSIRALDSGRSRRWSRRLETR